MREFWQKFWSWWDIKTTTGKIGFFLVLFALIWAVCEPPKEANSQYLPDSLQRPAVIGYDTLNYWAMDSGYIKVPVGFLKKVVVDSAIAETLFTYRIVSAYLDSSAIAILSNLYFPDTVFGIFLLNQKNKYLELKADWYGGLAKIGHDYFYNGDCSIVIRDPDGDDSLPVGWRAVNLYTDDTVFVSSTIYYSAPKSLGIYKGSSSNGGYMTYTTVVAPGWYEFKFKYRGEKVGTLASISVTGFAYNGASLWGWYGDSTRYWWSDYYYAIISSQANTWETYIDTVFIPTPLVKVFIYLRADLSPVTYYLDDFSLTRIR